MNTNQAESTSSSDDSSSYDSSSEDDELVEEQIQLETKCLFCDCTHRNPDESLIHVRTEHDVDLIGEFKKRSFDCLDFIKMVNFVRSTKPDPQSIFVGDPIPWKIGDQFMKPVLLDDPLLIYDFDSNIETASDEMSHDGDLALANGDGSLHSKLKEAEQRVNVLKGTVSKMRSSLNTIMMNDEKLSKSEKKQMRRETNKRFCNENYFTSYSHFGIHHEMLSDKVRTDAYRDSILKNPETFKDQTVLDVGCGTGILSMFAASSGAANVYAVDESDIAFYAMTIVTENNMKNKIEVIKSRLENIGRDLKVDIIVSEWMGYFLVYEGMLDTIIYARDKMLKPGGIILPNRCTVKIAGICNEDFYKKHVSFWDNVYGYSMKSLKSECISEPLVTLVQPEWLITSDQDVALFDIMTCTLEEAQKFESEFSLKCSKDGTIHAIAGWFVTYFDHPKLKQHFTLPTSPSDPSTHWKQTSFLLRNPIVVKQGDCVTGKITANRPKDNDRALRVELAFRGGDTQEFFLI